MGDRIMHIHVVNRGESLWQIAQRYGADLNQIILVNQMDDPNVLIVGQAIVVPEPESEYVIQAGDTLGSIASRYGVTVQELAEVNNIEDPSLIFIGQMLKMPYLFYTVRPGDTLWVIANRYEVTVDQIVQANQMDNPNMILVGETLRIPVVERPTTEINAYITQMDEEGQFETLMLGRHFTYISPFMYSIREDGSLTEMQESGVLEAARANGVAPLLTLTNFRNSNFDSDLAASVLRNQTVQDTLITNLINKMKEKGYAGINIDFEYVYPEDRENYNNFLRRLVARAHPEGLLVSTALAPKERADQPGLLYEAHDYEAQGQIVDFIVVMTYEWGWAGGRPWAIAPINKVRDVLDYAVTAIPPNKIMMGIPLYGRDWRIPWVEGTTARTVSPKQAVSLAARYGAAIQYHDTYQSPFFRYVDEEGQEHEVWFEDARSMQAKYDVMKEYGLRGGSYWVLGNPFPQNWPVLEDNFNIRKL